MKYDPLRASLYMELPKEMKNNGKGLFNIQRKNDEKRFTWSMLVSLHPQH